MLQSMRILDFSKLLPGPYATMMLADLGAEILRVESPNLPDFIRELPPFDGEDSAVHQHLNRSKKSISLDLKKPEAAMVIKRLVRRFDIVLEQFRPGVMERLGLDYETLKQANPKIIYCSLTGYGQTGPYRQRAGHDNNYLSIAGVAGYSARENYPPVPAGIQIADIAGGSLHSVIAILSAVIHREHTGEGQYIDLSMTDASFSLNAMFGPGFLAAGVDPRPEGTELNGGSFYDYYQTKDGRYFSVGSLEPSFRTKLCEALGIPHMVHLAASTIAEDKKDFKHAVTQAFMKKSFEEWLVIFRDLEACVEPVLTFSEACEHPQLIARNMIVDVPKNNGTYQRQIASPIKSSAFNQEYKHIGGSRGADTIEILQQIGFDEAQINELIDKDVFGLAVDRLIR
ncbi:crotonobetainyl-CoA:carnitine CoA-transferase CaiB-like acyl-CoA transferase [Peribacillus deserti]|uniref:Crotonobetainyl-CoA:carnitine CoA-transferase CaiB-like acyl-CoA transferase n=1 Tax=Peribacillus deserti TaxID=673318 RepID=A0ABS2QEV4_9BACI|nr:CaiB/BaiF CoA-transferase family protein [Peribacillus deserti]MBM7691686.1 crotonobetainyl-CoA:carnitine CoA-transferase CaiB-like acyl-CoA transferase [Peribacillus deserti]